MHRYALTLALALSGMMLSACEPAEDMATKDMTAPHDHEPSIPSQGAATGAVIETEPDMPGRLESHVHGRATLAATVDDDQLTFTFEAPLVSMIGFEHEPQTESETAAVNALKDAFVTPGNMVSVNAESGCLPLMTSSGTHMTGGHGALEVEHVYTCEAPDRIETIAFILLDAYPGLQSIDAVFVSDTRQAAGELSAGQTHLDVR